MSGTLGLAGVPAATIPEGLANSCMGTVTLNGTTGVSVATTAVSSKTRVFLSTQAPGGTPGSAYVSSITPGTGFTVKSTGSSDTSAAAWFLIDHT